MKMFGKMIGLSILAVIITACGFQLRGNVNLPAGVEPIHIGGIDGNSQLALELRNLLKASGITLAAASNKANYSLDIISQQSDRRTASLGEGARVAEYLLIEEASFQLLNSKAERVLGPIRITERNILPNDPNKVVSSSEEEALLRREMLQNMAAKIARQLQLFDYQAAVAQQPASNQ